ncbi:MAG TPA: adenylate/guanylate cyclase domain-containing protein [Spirochaetes bacterium]|nr:adenylate/guanylate cyclase domain-containing protein [Spirochaetota bacterium]
MNNLIPYFIHEKLQKGESSGSMDATALFLDISGFTRLTESLMQHGKEGAEILSNIINRIFTLPIQTIYSNGGFITTFAGDAFTAIFPGNGYKALIASLAIKRIFSDFGETETRGGTFKLAARTGISSGSVEWTSIGTPAFQTYLFYGDAIDSCVAAEKHADIDEIVFDRKVLKKLTTKNLVYSELSDDYFLLNKLREDVHEARMDPLAESSNRGFHEISRNVLERFYPQSVIDYSKTGEFRTVAAVFISIKNNKGDMTGVVKGILAKSEEFGGYFNSLDSGDKGCLALVVFGAPVSRKDNLFKAVNFSLDLKEALFDKIRIGINYGTVFAGLLGSNLRNTYTVLGDVVNISARITMSAEWGTIRVSRSVSDRSQNRYILQSHGPMRFKGKELALDVYELEAKRAQAGKGYYDVRFIGRDDELKKLDEWSKSIFSSTFAGIIYIYGEAGTGKTRLVDEFLSVISEGVDVISLEADGVIRKSLNPLTRFFNDFFQKMENKAAAENRKSFDRVFSELLDDVRKLKTSVPAPQIVEELERVKSILGSVIGLHWPGSLFEQLEPENRFENTVFALKEFFKAKSLLKPLVITLENLHWIDEDSKKVFEMLSNNIQEFPILIIASGRMREDGSNPVFFKSENIAANEITLDNLSSGDVLELISEKLGGRPDEELAGYISQKTEGNPFYVEQLCQYFTDNRLIKEGKDGYHLTVHKNEVPAGMNSLLVSRIDSLPAELKEAVQAASVIGREFDPTILTLLLKKEDIDELISLGERTGVWQAQSKDRCIFKYGMLRDAAYEMQLKDQLRETHMRIGQSLEDLHSGEEKLYADIAYHYENSGIKSKTIEYYKKSALYARENYKNEKALLFYDKLLDFAESEYEKVKTLDLKSAVFELVGEWEQSASFLKSGIEMADRINLPKKRAELRVHLGEIYQKMGSFESARRILEEAIDITAYYGDTWVISRSYMYLGRTYWSMGKFESALEYYEKAMGLKKELNDEKGIGLALYYTGVVHRDTGNYELAMDQYRESEQIFKKLGDKRFETYPLYDMGVIYKNRGMLDQSAENFEKVKEIYQEIGYKSGISAAFINLGAIQMQRGNYKEASEYFSDSLNLAEDMGEKLAISYALFSIGVVHYQRGDPSGAFGYLKKALSVMQEIKAVGYYGYAYSYLTCLYARYRKKAMALKVAYHHLKNMETIKSDVENGRTHLGIALALSAGGPLTGEAGAYLKKIMALTGLSDSPGGYFETAISESQKNNYVTTLVPALREYGIYLAGRSPDAQKEQAIEKLKAADVKARESDMKDEIRKIGGALKKLENS